MNSKPDINTEFPAEFPQKKINPDNHIAAVVVNEIKPPAPKEPEEESPNATLSF